MDKYLLIFEYRVHEFLLSNLKDILQLSSFYSQKIIIFTSQLVRHRIIQKLNKFKKNKLKKKKIRLKYYVLPGMKNYPLDVVLQR